MSDDSLVKKHIHSYYKSVCEVYNHGNIESYQVVVQVTQRRRPRPEKIHPHTKSSRHTSRNNQGAGVIKAVGR